MIDEVTFRKKDKKVHKVVLILLVALASISGAKKDLNQFLALATDVHTFANHLISMLPANEAPTASPVRVCQIKEHTTLVTDSGQVPGRLRAAQGKSIKIKTFSKDIKTVNGGIAIFFPADLETRMPVETLDGTNSPEFRLNVGDELKAFERHDWKWPMQPASEDINQ